MPRVCQRRLTDGWIDRVSRVFRLRVREQLCGSLLSLNAATVGAGASYTLVLSTLSLLAGAQRRHAKQSAHTGPGATRAPVRVSMCHAVMQRRPSSCVPLFKLKTSVDCYCARGRVVEGKSPPVSKYKNNRWLDFCSTSNTLHFSAIVTRWRNRSPARAAARASSRHEKNLFQRQTRRPTTSRHAPSSDAPCHRCFLPGWHLCLTTSSLGIINLFTGTLTNPKTRFHNGV